jgi:hypothetical protein
MSLQRLDVPLLAPAIFMLELCAPVHAPAQIVKLEFSKKKHFYFLYKTNQLYDLRPRLNQTHKINRKVCFCLSAANVVTFPS